MLQATTAPSASASLLLDLYQALRSLQLAGPDDLLALGLAPEPALDLETRIPVAWLVRLWQLALRRGAPADLGLLLGQRRGLQTRGPVANLAALSATLGEALELFCRHSPVMSECESLRVERQAGRVRIVFLFSAPLAGLPPVCEYSLSSALCWARQMSGVRLLPLAVGLRHAALAGPANYRQVFGCAVRFGEAQDYIEMAEADMQLPMVGDNAYLKGLLQQRVSSMQAQLPIHSSLRRQVLRLIEQGLVSGEFSVAAVAERLQISRQTLHRHLREEDCCFSELLAQVRRQQALQRLAQPGCRVEALSRELGFSEPSAFYKAFKGWFGQSPKAYQQQAGAESMAL
ncbi:AraC family transcriptional regulator [Pseudomonas sp. J452]|uniref:AraC family transcriptional regulator n=1 Tax=Pseudomonas sp. J452 TaxID=2898441 RepID=UPI0021AD5774|nr:AraC family transcriptional regulator [Pseudomonas sp. J452]UUY10191.1 AraC family transcriptional regulator [Pseudomonas sp. J452]